MRILRQTIFHTQLFLLWSFNIVIAQDLQVEGIVATDSLQVSDVAYFSLRLASDLSSTNADTYYLIGGWTSVVDQSGHLSSHENFNNSTGVFSAPSNGYYFFSYSIRLDDLDGDYFRVGLSKNGLTDPDKWIISSIYSSSSTASFMTLSNSCVTRLNQGDTVQIMLYHVNDSNVIVDKQSWFNGYRISLIPTPQGPGN